MDAEAELKRRRERARIAQGAFRKRQAQAHQDLQNKHDRMQDAIRGILLEMQESDRLMLRSKIVHAAEVAGIDMSHIGICQQRILSDICESDTVPCVRQMGEGEAATASPRGVTAIVPTHAATPRIRTSQHMIPTHHSSTVYKDPFLYLGIVDPPDEMLPFLGQGAYTFGGRLVWYVLERAFAEHDQVHETSLQSTSSSGKSSEIVYGSKNRRQAVDLDTAIRQARSEEARLRIFSLISLLKTRLYGLQQGDDSVVSLSAPRKVLSWTPDLQQLVNEEYVKQNESPLNWIDPIATEQRVRAILGDEVFAVLCDAAKESWKHKQYVQGKPETVGRGLIDGLLDSLYEMYKCFGNGPRWNVSVLDGVVMQWALTMTTGCA